MAMNLSPNWSEWARLAKMVGGFTTAAGVALGAVTPLIAPLAATIPSLAPVAGMVAAVGLIIHGVSTGAKAMLESLEARGLTKTGPK